MYCSKCGSQNDSTAHFCIQCGESLQGGRVPPSPRPRRGGLLRIVKWGGIILGGLIVLVIVLAVVTGGGEDDEPTVAGDNESPAFGTSPRPAPTPTPVIVTAERLNEVTIL